MAIRFHESKTSKAREICSGVRRWSKSLRLDNNFDVGKLGALVHNRYGTTDSSFYHSGRSLTDTDVRIATMTPELTVGIAPTRRKT